MFDLEIHCGWTVGVTRGDNAVVTNQFTARTSGCYGDPVSYKHHQCNDINDQQF